MTAELGLKKNENEEVQMREIKKKVEDESKIN